jgi:hypothetical protein
LLASPADADATSILDAGGDFDVDGFELAVAVDLKRQRRSPRRLFKGEGDFMLDIRPRGGSRRGREGAGAADASAAVGAPPPPPRAPKSCSKTSPKSLRSKSSTETPPDPEPGLH